MIDKKMKPVVQGGVDNYLGKQPQVQAPRKWQSGPDKPATELAYITEAEKDLILKANIHGGLESGPNMGPSGIMSLDSYGDIGGAGAAGVDTEASGGAMEGRGFSGREPGESGRDFDKRKANQRAALQIAERKQARDLGYKERANIANRTYGPLRKYTGKSSLFGGANKFGYTDVRPDGSLKPGFGGRFFGGLFSLLTGIPVIGGAIGTAYDKGQGLFRGKPKDMSEFNKLGLGGIKPGTLDFDPNAKINQELTKEQLKGYDRFGDIGKPNINNLKSLIDSYTTGSINFNPGMTVGYGDGIQNVNPDVTESYLSASDLAPEFQEMAVQAKVSPQDLARYSKQKDLIDQQDYGSAMDTSLLGSEMTPYEFENMKKGNITKPGEYQKGYFDV
jgi:hypothetical protein